MPPLCRAICGKKRDLEMNPLKHSFTKKGLCDDGGNGEGDAESALFEAERKEAITDPRSDARNQFLGSSWDNNRTCHSVTDFWTIAVRMSKKTPQSERRTRHQSKLCMDHTGTPCCSWVKYPKKRRGQTPAARRLICMQTIPLRVLRRKDFVL